MLRYSEASCLAVGDVLKIPTAWIAGAFRDSISTMPYPSEYLRVTMLGRRPLIIAHRGLSWDYPENTLTAFAAAAEACGADLLELDVHATSDGELVCVHDDVFDRYLTDPVSNDIPAKRVDELSAAQVRSIDVGRWKADRFAGVTPPTLREVLSATTKPVLLERKTGTPEQVLHALTSSATLGRVIVQSFDWQFLRDFRRLQPAVLLVALGEGRFSPGHLSEVRSLGAIGVHWSRALETEDVAVLHAAGLFAWMYTLNTSADYAMAAGRGIDGITTDRADVALNYFRSFA